MDRIENLIRGLDPVRAERESSDSPTEIISFPPAVPAAFATDAGRQQNGATMDTESIDRGQVPGTHSDETFNDDHAEVVPFRRRRRVAAIIAGAAAAAAVAGAVVVGGTLGTQEPLPAASTDPTPTIEPSSPADPTPDASAEADPSPVPEPSAEQPAQPTVEPTGVPTGPPADEGCRVQDVDRVMEQGSDFMSLTPFAADPADYTVVGCTDEWMAMELTEEAYQANPQDGGNTWYYVARRVDGQWLVDSAAYSTLVKWDYLPIVDGRTPQEMMDQQFVDVGIPVELRPALVGEGPGAS